MEVDEVELRLETIYRRIGEIAVCFQAMESKVRDIGWLLLDPDKSIWPPTTLRDLTTNKLLKRVAEIYRDRVAGFGGSGAKEYCESFSFTIDRAHDARRARNALLHSAFVELKAAPRVREVVASVHSSRGPRS